MAATVDVLVYHRRVCTIETTVAPPSHGNLSIISIYKVGNQAKQRI